MNIYLSVIENSLIGRQRVQITEILMDVRWTLLHDLLDLNQKTSIETTCQNEGLPAECQLREVLDRFINSRDPEPCCKTVEVIAGVLKQSKNNKAAGELKEMCTCTGR